MMSAVWEAGPPAMQFRIARPTDQLEAVVRFYHDGLELPIIDSFGGEGHKGYTGVMFGLPGHDYHLEITQHEDGSPCPAPTDDNLLVFYIPERAAIDRIAAQLAALGHHPVAPENPYWEGRGVTIPDPDGWRIVLMNTEGI
jgi:catechol 2,3-dioxygenase-like lactoylglutathione lyase family enzyme